LTHFIIVSAVAGAKKGRGAKSNIKNIGAGVEDRWCRECEVGEKKKSKNKDTIY
jgi:hypothetical protein